MPKPRAAIRTTASPRPMYEMRSCSPLWDDLFQTEQARTVQLLVERAEIAEDRLDIQFRTARLAGLVCEFGVDARAAA